MKILFQVVTTILLSVIISLTANLINPKGIPLIGKYSREARLEDIKIKKQVLMNDPAKKKMSPTNNNSPVNESDLKSDITLKEAYESYMSAGAIFIDSRKKEEFTKGHIRGAINIYADQFDENKDILVDIPKEIKIITYCGGTDCDLSIELANRLVEFGYFDVRIFFGGWLEWKNAGYPIENSNLPN
jgi:rhodanese-related sulfurtransferase